MSNTLSACNCLHVAYLVYQRLIAVRLALQHEKIPTKQTHSKAILSMWTLSLLINLVPPTAAYFNQKQVLMTFKMLLLHGFHTLPIICIIVMYVILIHSIKLKNNDKETVSTAISKYSNINMKTKLSTKMIKGVIVCLIFCYLPYLVWWQYSMETYQIGGERWLRNCTQSIHSSTHDKGHFHTKVKSIEVSYCSILTT